MMFWLAAGCSSTATPPADGAAGATGSGGSTGSGGADGGDACAAVMAAYATAYQNALNCNPNLDSLQCTKLASPALPCGSCGIYVNDTAELDQLRTQYYAVCPPVACPAIACVNPGRSICVAASDGATIGVCTRVPPL